MSTNPSTETAHNHTSRPSTMPKMPSTNWHLRRELIPDQNFYSWLLPLYEGITELSDNTAELRHPDSLQYSALRGRWARYAVGASSERIHEAHRLVHARLGRSVLHPLTISAAESQLTVMYSSGSDKIHFILQAEPLRQEAKAVCGIVNAIGNGACVVDRQVGVSLASIACGGQLAGLEAYEGFGAGFTTPAFTLGALDTPATYPSLRIRDPLIEP